MSHPYCAYVSSMTNKDDVDKIYHDSHYGVPILDDDELFGRLIMEINQAGLSWRTILLKEKGFRKAYDNFSIQKVSNYKGNDIARLLGDASIIRNNLKINATIYNAQKIIELQKEWGSFRRWLDQQNSFIQARPGLVKSKEEDIKEQWVKLFKHHFKFVGGEIVGEFLMSIDILPGSHGPECERFISLKTRYFL